MEISKSLMKFVKQMLGKYVPRVLTSAINIKNGFGVPGNDNKFIEQRKYLLNVFVFALFSGSFSLSQNFSSFHFYPIFFQ